MVDEAVLRRFSIQHEVGLPDQDQRAAILKTCEWRDGGV
jgi:SpoVK/Ycf46/Vps4 family AAA+-type ATPase